MGKYRIIRKKFTLIYLEQLALALLISALCHESFDLLIGVSIAIFIVILIGVFYLIEVSKIFRVLFSVLFSVCWGGIGYFFAYAWLKPDKISPIIIAGIVLVLFLFFHKDFYRFNKTAKTIEVERN